MLSSDLPADLPGFMARFGTDDACRDYLFSRRWPEGFRCPRCHDARHYRLETRIVYECVGCRFQHALLAGTIFEQTKTPLHIWFLAIHLFLSSKGGVSALELKRQLGFKSDQTAWSWLHKLRAALSLRGTPLEGPVEVDETLLGGPLFKEPGPGKRGRPAGGGQESGAGGKTLVAGAVEVRVETVAAPDPEPLSGAARARAIAMAERLAANGDDLQRCLGRIRLAVIGAASADVLGRFIEAAVAPGTAITTDGWAAYRRPGRPRPHSRIIVSKVGPAHEHLPAIHLVFTLLKRLLIGTYHGGVGRHLPRYLDEFVFRFNRKCLSPIARVMAGIDRAIHTQPLTLQMIFART